MSVAVKPPATVAVFGATGRTGQPLVRRLLEAGYAVRAQARTPAKMDVEHERLEVVQGDYKEATDVAAVVAGSDAVINLVGHVKGSAPDVLTQGIAHVVSAMRGAGITRIVNLTGAGVEHPDDRPKLVDKIFRRVMRTFFSDVIHDATESSFVLRASELDYTNVRAPRLTEGESKGTRRVGVVGEINSSLTRVDLADFLVEVLREGKYVGEEPAVSN